MLAVNNIEVLYDRVILVLEGVSLNVPRGSIVALLGANGAGKTTTPEGHLQPAPGRARRGRQRRDPVRRRRGAGAVAQRTGEPRLHPGDGGTALLPHLTIEENLLTGAFTRRDGRAAVRRALGPVYSYFPRLRERRSATAGYTSGGEQQMCAIGRALMSRPRVILLDEPSMGLAPQIVDEIFAIIGNLNAAEGGIPAGGTERPHGAQMRALRLHP